MTYSEIDKKRYGQWKHDEEEDHREHCKRRGLTPEECEASLRRYNEYQRKGVNYNRVIAAGKARYLQERGIITPESLHKAIKMLDSLGEDDYYVIRCDDIPILRACSYECKIGIIRGDVLAKQEPFISLNNPAEDGRYNCPKDTTSLDSKESLREMMGCTLEDRTSNPKGPTERTKG